MESNSQLQQQEQQISEVQMSRLPLQERWKYIEADLIACELNDNDIDQYFADYYTALYFLFKDQSASAYYCRALNDLYAIPLAERSEDSKGVPFMVVLLCGLLGKYCGYRSSLDIADYLKENAATLQVLLPGFPKYSELLGSSELNRVLGLVNETDVRNLMESMIDSVLDLLFHVNYRPQIFTRDMAKNRFLECYGLEDPVSSIGLIPLDVRETVRRYVRHLHRADNGSFSNIDLSDEDASFNQDSSSATKSKRSKSSKHLESADLKAKSEDTALDLGADGQSNAKTALSSAVTAKRRTQVRGRALNSASANDNSDQAAKPQVNPFFKTVLDMLDVQLQTAHLPRLTQKQRDKVLTYAAMRFEVWNEPILCENTAAQVALQNAESSFKYLKELDPKLLADEENFDPRLVLHYHDPRQAFGNCIYDTLNDFIMPLVCDKKHPAYKYEVDLRDKIESAIANDDPCIKISFREPQTNSLDFFVQETWYLFSLSNLGFTRREYSGKTPVQGWNSVICRTINYVSRSDLKQSLSATAEQFNEIRTEFFERNSELLEGNNSKRNPDDVVSILRDNMLDNYSLGIIAGPKGSVAGFVQTSLPKKQGDGFGLYDGMYIVEPKSTRKQELTGYYVSSLQPNLKSMIKILGALGPKDMIWDFYSHVHKDKMDDIEGLLPLDNLAKFDYLRKFMLSEMRYLHQRQTGVSSGDNQVSISVLRDVMVRDVYYLIDSFVFISTMFHYAYEIGINQEKALAQAEAERKARLAAKAQADADAAKEADEQDGDDVEYGENEENIYSNDDGEYF